MDEVLVDTNGASRGSRNLPAKHTSTGNPTPPGFWPDFPAVRIVGRPHPFKSDRIDLFYEHDRSSVAELLESAGFDWLLTTKACGHVFLGEHRIPRHLWRVVRPKAGTTLYVTAMPGGGGGGAGKILRSILQIAILVISVVVFWWAGGTDWGALAAAAIPRSGQLLLNAKMPPQASPMG